MEIKINPLSFKIPVYKIRAGYYSDKDTLRTAEILKKSENTNSVLQQFVSLKEGIIFGLEEALSIIKLCTGFYNDIEAASKIIEEIKNIDIKIKIEKEIDELKNLYIKKVELIYNLNTNWIDKSNEIKIFSLNDGAKVKKGDVILAIQGNFIHFSHLETILTGLLTRGSSISTSVNKVIKAANNKPVLFFASRYDHFSSQSFDGYAALKGGAFGVSTDANADWTGLKSNGTISNSLIACYEGSIEKALENFDNYTEENVKRIVVTGWNNDSITDALKCIEYFKTKYSSNPVGPGKNKIWGIRFDNLKFLRDKSVTPINEKSLGVSPELIWKARKIFDDNKYNDLKIVASGGFTYKKIKMFEKLNVPVDIYGVGSYLLKRDMTILSDIVMVNNKHCSRKGVYKRNFSKLVEK